MPLHLGIHSLPIPETSIVINSFALLKRGPYEMK